ncbi:DUF4115 domain-containing protein, partial [Sphingomonas segetis]|uniref:DUF4115 domain-containing protein n=1 Tax=Sphingomonas segetis TaxID=1104779 RepID=UPI0012D34644
GRGEIMVEGARRDLVAPDRLARGHPDLDFLAVRVRREIDRAAADGPVVLTATGQAWVRVTDGGKTLFEATMQPGQTYQVPPTSTAPMLRVGAPEAVRINVGNAVAPPVGPAGQVTSNVSLKGTDLMRGGAQPAAPAGQ